MSAAPYYSGECPELPRSEKSVESVQPVESVQVIGIGSIFGDDRAGWWAADRLASGLPSFTGAALRISKLDRPGTALIELIGQAEPVILIDAVLATPAMPAGSVQVFDLPQLELAADAARLPLWSSHGIGLCETLGLARVLGRLPGRLAIITVSITADKTDCSIARLIAARPDEAPSAVLCQALPEISAQVLRLVAGWQGDAA